jgi:CDGSH iron-sulfur domain-containing protein 3
MHAPVEIKIRDDGPYKITGPIRLVDAEGRVLEVPEDVPVALCRCGRSETKPFCDGTHKGAFASRVRAA